MILCSDAHEEVCYESRDCPVCKLREELEPMIEELETERDNQKSEIEDLVASVDDLQAEVTKLEEELDDQRTK